MNKTGRLQSPPEENQQAAGPATRFIRRALDALARNWRDTVYLHERLQEAQRPWEQQAPLHWRRQLGGGWRVAGSYLPDDTTTGTPGVGWRSPSPNADRGQTPGLTP